MLVEIPTWHVEPMSVRMAAAGYPGHALERVARGMYWGHDHLIEHIVVNEYPFEAGHSLSMEERFAHLRAQWESDGPEGFGVCDSPEQIPARWPQLVEDPRSFVILLSEVRRDEQSERDGWRWEKHGSYIGVHEPQADYLHDEPEISSVLMFHIVEVDLARCLDERASRALVAGDAVGAE